ncbi:MAG: NYN domain-containing protein [Lachnospiraceae bacterium]|nr:NYN domain-containing protein [Lachnospiraceae bacterium]
MRIFYIDFENVKDRGLNGIAKLDAKDVVRIYYSEDANKMTFGTHRRIIESPAKFEYVRMRKDMKGVKNALDVILMNDLSDRMIEEKNAEYFIVSDDGDFDNYIQEKQKRKISINKIPEVCKASQNIAPNKPASNNGNSKEIDAYKKKEMAFRSHFGKYLKDEYDDNKEDILDAYMNASTRRELNNNLQQYFYNDAVSDILRRLSDLIKSMPGR